MQSYIECYPCFLRQAVEAGKMASNDNSVHWMILRSVLDKVSSFPQNEIPAIMGKEIHRIVRELSNNPDPYKEIKEIYNQKASSLLSFIDSSIEASSSKLLTGLKIIAIANIIDFGPFGLGDVKFEDFLNFKMASPFAGNIEPSFLISQINNSKTILYVADNCGEIIIDVYFINKFFADKKVYLSVRGGIVLNDATVEDIKDISFPSNVKVINNGDNAPGVVLKNCNQDFINIYNQVDLVILKGQGNFEGIGNPQRENIFSILVAKCPVIARHIGCNINDLILTRPR